MRAITMTAFGATPTLTDLDVPEPAEGEVRVRVRAASVNGFDLAVAAGYTKDFMELRNAQSVTIAYDGTNPMPPTFCYLKPYYNDVNKSYFRQLADGEL